jgi:hypothetical protein
MKRQHVQGPPPPSLPSSSGAFDGLAHDILDRIQQATLAAQPTMGTITTYGGGGDISVQVDGEKSSRTIAFSRALGVEYKKGDRVKLSVLRNGEYVIDGIYTTANTDQRVGSAQVGPKAIKNANLGDGSVSSGNLDPTLANKVNNALTSIPANSVGQAEIRTDAVGFDELKAGSVDWPHLRHAGKGSLGEDVERLVNFAKGKGWI